MFDPFVPLMLLGAAFAFVALLWVQRRLRASSLHRTTSTSVIAALWLLFVAGSAYFAWPLLFLGPDDPRTSMYVQVPTDLAPGAFHDKLAAILEAQGFRPSSVSISSPEAPQNPTYVLEARGFLTRIWSQTEPLGREEALACGYRLPKEDFVANDERQYFVAVTSVPLFQARAQATFAILKEQLLRSGFRVSSEALPCQRST